jgi:hypothetical protein
VPLSKDTLVDSLKRHIFDSLPLDSEISSEAWTAVIQEYFFDIVSPPVSIAVEGLVTVLETSLQVTMEPPHTTSTTAAETFLPVDNFLQSLADATESSGAGIAEFSDSFGDYAFEGVGDILESADSIDRIANNIHEKVVTFIFIPTGATAVPWS